MNICTKCNEPHNELTKMCSTCLDYFRRWRETHREQINAGAAIYRANHRKEMCASTMRWQEAHREERLEYMKRWRSENHEGLLRYYKKYRDEHPDNWHINNHNRRARIRGAGGSYTPKELNTLFAAQEYLCYYCNKPFFDNTLNAVYHIEHMIPIARGGTNDISNIAISCPHCNLSKHLKTADEFIGGVI